ncbi:MAG TPA: hypothetical protein VG755_43780 [Nannocystaceae bacterium]|nr:hypothetical protein [Nannocystaceae bacterium]
MNARILLLSLASLIACGPQTRVQAEVPTPEKAAAAKTNASTPTNAAAKRESIALAAAMHEVEVTEVILDPRGEAALTTDAEGGLRLWPNVRGTEVATPIMLPERESTWATLARSDDGAFVIATIDTQGGARVARVELGEEGARRTELFEIPVTDPQFELHVLDGGQRIVALGKDHRVRLFDADGKVKAEIDRVGFIPWQLRVAPTKDGVTPMVAVLTQPVRAQSIVIAKDTLEIVGDAHMVALDQSPNRNDLALSPDGKKVAALRRPQSKGKAFALQLITMATGERKVILGELDAKVRPRLHYVDEARALLETGTGKGFWLDLNAAVPKAQAEIPLTPVTAIPLPGAYEDLRMQVTVVDGIRAVPVRDGIVIDPIDSPQNVHIAKQAVAPLVVALDREGKRLAWADPSQVVVEEVGGGALRTALDNGKPLGLTVQDDGVIVVGRSMLLVDAQGTSKPTQGINPALPTARERRKAAEKITVGLVLHGGRLLRAEIDPTGRYVAVVERVGGSVDFAGLAEGGERLSVYDAKSRARLWTRPLAFVQALAWSGNGERLAVGSDAVRVIEAKSGESVLVRTDLGVKATEVADAQG